MATFQGDRFLREQLHSIRQQSRLPDELVVSDDASTDGTMAILAEFAGAAPFPVRIHRNPTTLGWARNFQDTIARCDGEIIVLADQDDVWAPDKVEAIVDVLCRPEYDFVLSDARILTESGRDTGKTLWQVRGFGAHQKQEFVRPRDQFRLIFRYGLTMGMASAFTRSLVEFAGPRPAYVSHDQWYVPVAAAGGCRGALIDRPLVAYRQHPGQASHGATLGPLRQIERTLWAEDLCDTTVLELWLQRLAELEGGPVAASVALLEENIHHLTLRRQARQTPGLKRMPLVARELASGRYARFSRGLRSALADLAAGVFRLPSRSGAVHGPTDRAGRSGYLPGARPVTDSNRSMSSR